MKIARSLALAAAFVAAPYIAHAQEDFPNKPIEVVIHSSYGGGTDTTARMMMPVGLFCGPSVQSGVQAKFEG